MGQSRSWEEDGIFERGVEVLSGDEEGIWLEKGSQSYAFDMRSASICLTVKL